MNGFILILFGVAMLSAVVTYILWRMSRHIKIIKYIPSLLCLLLGIYFYYLARHVRIYEGFKDLANFIYSVMLFTGFVSGALTGLILDARK